MKNSTYSSWSTESPPDGEKDATTEFELAIRTAKNELQRANERAESEFYKALRNAAPRDPQAISNAQTLFAQAFAIASENYRQAIANAERVRLWATSMTAAMIDSGVPPATVGPVSALVRRLAKWRAAALTSRFSASLSSDTDVAKVSGAKRFKL